jgi:hypothetical protein
VPWDDLIKSILGIEGGVHPALFLLVVFVCGWVGLGWRQSEKERREEYKSAVEAAAAAAALVHTKREEDQKLLVLALERSTTVLAANNISNESMTQSINKVTMALGEMVTRNTEWREHIKDYHRQAEQRQNDILSMLRSLMGGK